MGSNQKRVLSNHHHNIIPAFFGGKGWWFCQDWNVIILCKIPIRPCSWSMVGTVNVFTKTRSHRTSCCWGIHRRFFFGWLELSPVVLNKILLGHFCCGWMSIGCQGQATFWVLRLQGVDIESHRWWGNSFIGVFLVWLSCLFLPLTATPSTPPGYRECRFSLFVTYGDSRPVHEKNGCLSPQEGTTMYIIINWLCVQGRMPNIPKSVHSKHLTIERNIPQHQNVCDRWQRGYQR